MPTIDVTDAAQRLLDIIALPGQPGMFARRVAVQAWQSAGSPHVESAGRLYAEQKHLYDGWREHLPGFNPADNPDDESQRLAHVRFVAFDIDPTAERIKRLTAAGLIRPYTYEPWHWELPNVRSYALVRSIPATASLDLTPISEEDEMNQDQANKLEAIYQGLWNGGSNIVDGQVQKYNYGVLPIIVNNQNLIARIITEQAALSAAVGAISTGDADVAAVTAAARAGAKAALADLHIPTSGTITLK